MCPFHEQLHIEKQSGKLEEMRLQLLFDIYGCFGNAVALCARSVFRTHLNERGK